MVLARATRSTRSIPDLPGAGLGQDGRLASLHRASGGLGVEGVGLATPPTSGTVGPVDRHDHLTVAAQEPRQPHAVGAGALNTPGVKLAEPTGPGEQATVAAGGGGHADGVQAAAELIFGVGDVDIAMGIDPHGHARGAGVCHRGHGHLLRPGAQADGTRRPSGRTVLRWVWVNRLRSGHGCSAGAWPVVAAAPADRSNTRHQARIVAGQALTTTTGPIIAGLWQAGVHPTCHIPNTPPAALPLVNVPVIRLPGHHGKVLRDGYCRASIR